MSTPQEKVLEEDEVALSDSFDIFTGAAAFRRAVNVLTVLLMLVCLGALPALDRSEAMLCVLLCASFSAVYAQCVVRSDSSARSQLVGSFVLIVVWSALMAMLPVAVYLIFPIFFLCLRALPDYRGYVLVVGVTLIAVFAQLKHLTIGAVMGPAISALVCIGIHLTFQALARGAQERENLIKQLLETRQQLADTERAAGVAAERQRIAHEIHDTLAQGLSSIQMLLRVAEKDIEESSLPAEEKRAPLQRMDLARQTAADNLSEARAMIAALQPAALSKTSLEGAFHRVAEQIVGPSVSIAVEGDERQLPMRTEAALLRIGQGALGNVSKHSGAKRCQLTLTYGPDEVRLDVVDDGRGFDPDAVKDRPAGLGHIGISAMRQRAEEQGGTLSVESAPGEGTAISVGIPVVNT